MEMEAPFDGLLHVANMEANWKNLIGMTFSDGATNINGFVINNSWKA